MSRKIYNLGNITFIDKNFNIQNLSSYQNKPDMMEEFFSLATLTRVINRRTMNHDNHISKKKL